MPYDCARAVCTLFCHPIAGALIPIFGPDFPHDCVGPDSPRFGRMDIDPEVIQSSTRNAIESRAAHELQTNGYETRLLDRPTSHPRNFCNYAGQGATLPDPLRELMTERLRPYSSIEAPPSSVNHWQPPTPMSYSRYQGFSHWTPAHARDPYVMPRQPALAWRPYEYESPSEDLANVHPMLRPVPDGGLQAREAYPKPYTAPADYFSQPKRGSRGEDAKRRKMEHKKLPRKEQTSGSSYDIERDHIPESHTTEQTIGPIQDNKAAVDSLSKASMHEQDSCDYSADEEAVALMLVNMRDKPTVGAAGVTGSLKRQRARSM